MQPSLNGFSPMEGAPGTTVVISGEDLGGASDVQFNGASASFSVDSDSQLTATVPGGASSGPISVVTPDGTATSADSFEVLPAPSITGFSPVAGQVGATVVVSGSGFTGASDVQFNGVSASFSGDSDSQITATVPGGASSGPISVVTPDGTATSADDFHVEVPPARPNVVVILMDDAAAGDLANMPVTTHLVADQGETFTNYYVSNNWCCPGRSTLLLGLPSTRTDIWRNVPPHGGWATFHAAGEDTRDLPIWLHDAGYATSIDGKYLNGCAYAGTATVPACRQSEGWDDWHVENLALNGVDREGTDGYCNWQADDNGALDSYADGCTSNPAAYSTTVLGNDAVDFIDSAPADQPVFVWYAPRAPHLPATPEPRYAHACRGVKAPQTPDFDRVSSGAPAYMAGRPPVNVAAMNRLAVKRCRTEQSLDDQVADIVQALADTGRLAHTLILVTSDNGYLLGQHRWNGKIVPYADADRVPMVVRSDGRVAAGSASDGLLSNIDFARTVAVAAGVTPPDGTEGVDFLDGQVEQKIPLQHQGPASPRGEPKVPSVCGVRTADWTYIQLATGEEELYALGGDPYEMDNLAGDPDYAGERSDLHADAMALCTPRPPGWPRKLH